MFKNLKFLLSLFLFLTSIFMVFPFSGGTGTLADPYTIITCQHLQDMNLDLGANYTLGSNIDCTGFDFNPIGNCTGDCESDGDDTPFLGNFEGNSYTISNLNITSLINTGNNGWGLFGNIRYGDITNIYIEDAYVFANDSQVGSLIGFTRGASITNISSTGLIQGNNTVGGLVGYAFNADIDNSHFEGVVAGNISVGGLIGYGESSYIYTSFSNASVTGNVFVGGFGGYFRIFSNIFNSYSDGTVIGTNFVGGFAGESYASYIKNSYSKSSVSGTHLIGGLVGLNSRSATIENSFSISNVTGINTSSTGAFVGVNDGDYSFPSGEPAFIDNSFFYNHSGNPDVAIGLDVDGGAVYAVDNLSYFYNESNAPFVYIFPFPSPTPENWSMFGWNFTGNNLPYLSWQENSNSQIGFTSQSTTSLFPIGGMVVSLLLILCFLLF